MTQTFGSTNFGGEDERPDRNEIVALLRILAGDMDYAATRLHCVERRGE